MQPATAHLSPPVIAYNRSRKSVCSISASPQTMFKRNSTISTAPQPPEPYRFKNGHRAYPIAGHNHFQQPQPRLPQMLSQRVDQPRCHAKAPMCITHPKPHNRGLHLILMPCHKPNHLIALHSHKCLLHSYGHGHPKTPQRIVVQSPAHSLSDFLSKTRAGRTVKLGNISSGPSHSARRCNRTTTQEVSRCFLT